MILNDYLPDVRASRSKKSSGTVADGNKSAVTGAGAIKSGSDDEMCDVTDDVSEDQEAEVLPLVSERPIRAVIERRQIAVGDLWSYVADKKLSTSDSLKDEYDVCICMAFLSFYQSNQSASHFCLNNKYWCCDRGFRRRVS